MNMSKPEGPVQNRWNRTRVWWGYFHSGEAAVEIHFYAGARSQVVGVDVDAAKLLRNQLNAAISQSEKARR